MTYIEWEIELHDKKRDAAFYTAGDSEVIGVLRSKDSEEWEPIYVAGEMKVDVWETATAKQAGEEPNDCIFAGEDFESHGIKSDADLDAAETRLEWHYNPWFEVGEEVCHTIDEVIEYAKTYKF